MSRMIVVEGPDGAGKSALVAKLSRDLGRSVDHTGGPTPDRQGWLKKMADLRDAATRPVIVDRIPHISEPIYRPLEGREPFDPPETLLRELVELDPVIVYCFIAPADQMLHMIDRGKKDHKPSDHMKLVIANHRKICDRYSSLMGRLKFEKGMDVFYYDWTRDRYAYLLKDLRSCVA